MVPISRSTQFAGMVAAAAIGYSLSWLVTPGPGTGPVDGFGPTFGQALPPVVVAPAAPRDERSIDASQPLDSPPVALQSQRAEPI